jgi:hypothetical protein
MKKIILFFALLSAAKINAQFCFMLFAQYSNVTPNNNMFGMCKGDFNVDGILDLAVTNTNSNSVTIFQGMGGGNFTAAGVFSCGNTPHQIIAADFNNDGALDLATANFGASNVSVLMNSGTGNFSTTNFFSGTAPKSITSADFNNDGNMDIAVVNSGSNNYSAFLGNGLGSFSLSQSSGVGSTPYGICSADFNKDGKQDLVTVSNSNGQALYIQGLGNGSFLSAQVIGSLSLSMPYEVTAADLNADGNPDIAVASDGSASVDIAFGMGNGSFNSGPMLATGNGPRMVAVGDLNDDGVVDLACPNYNSGSVSLFQGFSGGAFGGSFQLGSGNGARTAVVADFNGDGMDDMAVTYNGINILYIYLNTKPNPVVSGTTTYCAGGSTTLTASGATTYTWSTGATTNTVSLNPVATTTYYVAGGDMTCSLKDTAFFTVTVNPNPTVTATANPPFTCPGAQMTLSGGGANTYTWSGGVVNGVSFSSPTVTTTYTVSGTDNNGCVGSNTITVSGATLTVPNICMVTVDSLSVNNLIIWDKTLYPSADTFMIYRDTANNNYTVVGIIPATALSQYADTARSIGAVNGDPNITTYRYKLAYKDTCGTTSPLSPYHNTIYNYNISSLFLWNHYEIEGQPTPVAGLSNYVLKRDNLGGTGNYVTAATAGASSTSINDPQYGTWQTSADWRVETIWNITCTPTSRFENNGAQGTIVKSKSNITNNKTTHVQAMLDQLVALYPNPAQDVLTVHFNLNVTGTVQLRIYAATGAEVYAESLVNPAGDVRIETGSFAEGIYTVQLITGAGIASKRIVKQ